MKNIIIPGKVYKVKYLGKTITLYAQNLQDAIDFTKETIRKSIKKRTLTRVKESEINKIDISVELVEPELIFENSAFIIEEIKKYEN